MKLSVCYFNYIVVFGNFLYSLPKSSGYMRILGFTLFWLFVCFVSFEFLFSLHLLKILKSERKTSVISRLADFSFA